MGLYIRIVTSVIFLQNVGTAGLRGTAPSWSKGYETWDCLSKLPVVKTYHGVDWVTQRPSPSRMTPLTPSCRYSVRVSPQMANRIVDSARSILNKFIPDIYIYTDHMKGINSGKSPGFGLSLVAETTNGTFLSAELASNPQGQGAAMLPEDLGRNCARLLLEEIYRGGCVDSTNQSLALLLMTLGQQDVSKVLLGPLSPYTIEFLRHLKSFFQIMFKIETKPCGEELKGGDKVLMTCVGIGFSNLSKTLK
ncbi:RNA 3'-terminal phosphate cyclase-like protein isoform X2 [Oryx dammah]|uniref:RNA 3'-terminal phosphate cyclase-like protein isoform X2 n=1 Tax=Oryx dammah TaxID=59534 RepID=UPI001A9AA99A|nr:RNA 3'-terminal phosphate cyclase-like protein isoform X2 [Oryx dammah]